MKYKYITEDNLQNRQNYMYSEFGGELFIEAYGKSRDCFIGESVRQKYSFCINGRYTTEWDLNKLKYSLMSRSLNEYELELVDSYVKSFEVRKRLYQEYDENWKPNEEKGYRDYNLYLDFAECMALLYGQVDCKKYLSVWLKVDDTILSISSMLTVKQQIQLEYILTQEKKAVNQLSRDLGVEIIV